MNEMKTEQNMVIKTASIILDKPDAILSIPIVYENSSLGIVRLQFIEDKEDFQTRYKIVASEENLNIIGYNFKDSLGTATIEPVEIGRLAGKRITMQIYSRLMGTNKKVRLISYTIFKEL